MTNTETVPARDLQPGDFLIRSEVWVEEVYLDDDGVWVEFSDGDAGYCESGSRFRVERA